MSQQGRYIYGIIEEQGKKQFGVDGIGDNGVVTINYKDLAAVVSCAPVKSYNRFEEQSIAPGLKTHQLVLENVMRDYTVIPMGFGIIAQSENDVKKLLKAAYIDLKDTLREIDNRIELNVQVVCSEAGLLNEVVSNNETVNRLSRELLSGNTASDKIRIEVGRMVAAALHELKGECRRDTLEALNKVAVTSCPGKLSDAQMIVNESFLVARDREAEFDREVDRLAETHKGRLKFKYLGPMPAYSFVNLIATMVNFETIDKAKQSLGVGEQASLADIKGAYRKLARQYHPDTNSNDPEKEERFKEITEASEMLLRCTKSLTAAENGQYSFSRDQIEDVILISRRR